MGNKDTANQALEKRKRKVSDLTLYIGVLAIIVAFTIICALNGKNFLSWANISNIIVQSSIVAVVAIGASIIVLTGGIDLSCGAIVGFVGMATALMISAGMNIALACILGILIGCGFGLLTGIGVSLGKIPPFIMTLGIQGIAAGMTLAISGSKPVSGFPQELGFIANSTLFGIPVFILYVAALYAVMVFIMSKTRFGRHVYAIGGNINAARLSGVSVHKITTAAYVIGGLFAAVGGIMLLSRLLYASTTAGSGYELDAIAAAVIGGISLSGGRGRLVNTLFGALILGILKAGLQILDVSTYFQAIAIGVIIIVAVFLDKGKERKAE